MAVRREATVQPGHEILLDIIMRSDMTDGQKLADGVTFLIGGIHTGALWLIWCLYYLAENQDIQDRVRSSLECTLCSFHA